MGGGKGGGENAEFGKGDVGILNFALTLEYLESTFYAEAKKRPKPSGELTAAGSVVQVEARHAAAIRLQRREEPAPAGFDEPLDENQVLKAVEPFIA